MKRLIFLLLIIPSIAFSWGWGGGDGPGSGTVTPSSTDTFTNKTIDADGTGNSITNIENENIKAAAAIDATKIGDGNVSNAEFDLLDGKTALGDVVGPASSTNMAVPKFDGTGGKTLLDSGCTISADNVMTCPGGFASGVADGFHYADVTNSGDLDASKQAAGRLSFDNTAQCFKARNNDNTITFSVGCYVKTFSFGIDNVIDGDDILLWKVLRAVTITQVDCYASTDNVVGVLSECTAADVTSCTAVDSTDWTVTNAVGGFSVNSGFENATIAAGAWLKWVTTSEGTTNSNKLSCTVQYRD